MATYTHENDELRQELRKDAAGAVVLWPKVAGEGNVLCSAATYSVRTPSGVEVQTGTATVTDIGDPAEYSRISCAIDALSTLDEDYQCRVTWTQTDGDTYLDVVSFDVVLWPYGRPSVSLNDILEERPDAGRLLARLGARLGYAADEAAARYAAVLAVRARVELDARIRQQIESQAAADVGPGTTEVRRRHRYSRPHLVINRERLNRFERKAACALMFQANMSSPEGDDESAALYQHFREMAESAWRGVGPLKFDEGADLIPDRIEPSMGNTVRLVRSW